MGSSLPSARKSAGFIVPGLAISWLIEISISVAKEAERLTSL
jgi:hypothetical protein